MKRWAVFNKDGDGILLDFDYQKKREAEEWFDKHKDGYAAGCELRVWEFETEEEELRRKVKGFREWLLKVAVSEVTAAQLQCVALQKLDEMD